MTQPVAGGVCSKLRVLLLYRRHTVLFRADYQASHVLRIMLSTKSAMSLPPVNALVHCYYTQVQHAVSMKAISSNTAFVTSITLLNTYSQ